MSLVMFEQREALRYALLIAGLPVNQIVEFEVDHVVIHGTTAAFCKCREHAIIMDHHPITSIDETSYSDMIHEYPPLPKREGEYSARGQALLSNPPHRGKPTVHIWIKEWSRKDLAAEPTIKTVEEKQPEAVEANELLEVA